MTKQAAWVLSAAIIGTMVAVVLFVASNTGQLGFDGDDEIQGAIRLAGWL